MRVKTTADFINKASKIHGNTYDYSKAVYFDKLTKVEIRCREHGAFFQSPDAHYNRGCPSCSAKRRHNAQKSTTAEFVKKAIKKHGNHYDYSSVNYVGKKIKVSIICKKHGVFEQSPSNHISGGGCPACAGVERYTMQSFVRRAKEIYGDRFTYEKITDGGCFDKVIVTCPKHGDFKIRANTFIFGKSKCVKCDNEKRKNQFILMASKTHNNKYGYEKVEYIDSQKNVCIICPKHGEFWQTPYNHSCGSGCVKCHNDSRRRTTEQFIKDATKIHGDRYDYSLSKYSRIDKKILIICKIHGQFLQKAQDHLNGYNCPRCRIYKGEELVAKCLNELNETFERQKEFDECRDKRKLPFDFYIHSRRLLIEFDGVQHYYPTVFGGKRTPELAEETLKLVRAHDKIKNEFVKKYNYNLVRIPYWKSRKQEIMMSHIKNALLTIEPQRVAKNTMTPSEHYD